MPISTGSEGIIKDFLTQWWADLDWKIRETLLGMQLPHADAETLYRSGFGGLLRQMAAAAEGRLPRDEVNVGEVQECVQHLAEWMWARPGMPGAYHIPEEFWATSIGDLALRAHLWASGDELITMRQASELSGRSLSDLSNLVARGRLTVYPDPAEPNPTRANRLQRREVEALPTKRARSPRSQTKAHKRQAPRRAG